eukprot:TRINITY_DN4278_c0_g1_i1.p1 TRINITY_DN4278_c0_g1~~TRINITY_DN4278_c0_g1_i1.p1  ORF type:complete len:524 (+),score=208.10 TRINITY_DN4278_c0_g1_i1:60-1631(+)
MSKTFTRKEVAQHAVAGDMWVVIEEDVYDLSKFARMHPGGEAVLTEFAGQDATDIFFEQHKLDVLRKYQRLKIGRVADAKQKTSIVDRVAPDALSGVEYAEIAGLDARYHSFYYNESHREFRAACRKIIEGMRATTEQYDKAGKEPTRAMLKQVGTDGLFAARLGPGYWMHELEKHGVKLPGGLDGKKFDQFHEAIAHVEFARLGTPGMVDAYGSGHLIGLPPILHFGTPAMKEKYVGPGLRGECICALAITEPFVGSDVAGIKTTAKKSACGKYYVLNGAKKWITNASYADVFVVAVRTGGKGAKGLSMVLVDAKESSGITCKKIETSYTKCAGTSYVEFKDVKVPVENLMGKEGEGFKLVMHNFNHERWVIILNVLGQSRAIIEDCFKWAKQRKVFGKPLIEQPVIRFKLARMISHMESCWAWLEAITNEMNRMETFAERQTLGGPTALCKFHATRTQQLVIDEAVQIFGGRGLTKSGMGARLEGAFRFSKTAAVYGGSEEICAELGVKQALRNFPKDAKL